MIIVYFFRLSLLVLGMNWANQLILNMEGVGVGGISKLSMKTVRSETNIGCTGKRLGPGMFIG
jgi:hypothetical protein